MSVWAAYRSLLSNRPLSKVLLGEFVSSIGDGVYYTALAVLVYTRTGDAAILGVVGAAIVVPRFVLSIPAGFITDRFDRRLVLLFSDIGCATCMVVLSILVGSDAGIIPIAAVSVLAAGFSVFFTPAFGALLPTLVRSESEFGPANSAWATLDNLAWVVGPALAGAVLLTGNIGVAFVLNATSYILIAFVLWTLPAAPVLRPAASSVAATPGQADQAAARAGIRSIRLPASLDRSAIAGVVLLNSISWAAYGGMTIVMVILAVEVLDAGEAATGYLNLAFGAGGATGAILSGILVLRPRLAPALLVAGAAAAAAMILLGVAPALPVALIAVAITAAGMMILDVAMTTIYQRVVPDAYRGRFTGLLVTSSGVAEASGTLLVPALIGGVSAAIVLGGLGLLLFAATVTAIALVGRAADVAPGEFDAILRRFARLPVFGGLPASEVEAGLRRMAPIRVDAGSVVIRQGDVADRFYVVAEGSFDVTVAVPGTVHHMRQLGRDAVFGERGLLARSKRTASVTAREPSLLFAMDGQAFLDLVTRRGAVAERLLALYDVPAEPLDAGASS